MFFDNIFKFNQIKYFMQGIRLKEVISEVRDPQKPHTSVEISHHVGSGVGRDMKDPSSFTQCLPGVCRSPLPPISVVLRSSLGLSINAFSMGSFSTPQSFASSQTWVSSTTHGQRVTFGGLSPHPIQRVGA